MIILLNSIPISCRSNQFTMSDHIDNSTNENPNYLKIPKIFHQIWFDFGNGNKIPTNFERNTKRLLELHPGWEIKLWSEEQVEKLIIDNVPEFLDVWQGYDKKIKKHDSSRVIILHTHGGVYLDHDFIPIKNIEVLLGDNTFVIASEETSYVRTCNAFLASTKENPLLFEVLNDMYQPENRVKFVTDATGPGLWTESLRHYLSAEEYIPGIKIYHPKFLFPCHWNQNCDRFNIDNISQIKKEFPDCFLFQGYANSWSKVGHDKVVSPDL